MSAAREAKSPLKPLYCLSGCTAVGKTELALRWAEQNEAEIVSCDSLLFYRGMDIGTAKPGREELARVPHHMIDIVEPPCQMDVGRYVELAIETIGEIQSRGREVLVTGGSGFYLKAFFEPVVDEVQVSAETRRKVAGLMDSGLGAAVSELELRNPQGLGSLDTLNPRRVAKALERCWETGSSLAEIRERFARQSNPLIEAPKRLTILWREPAALAKRIERRVRQMVEQGLVPEVERLVAAGFEANHSAAGAIGYRETLAYLRGEYSLPQLIEAIATHTRQLAKKQRTWFRGQLPPDARWLELDDSKDVAPEDLFADMTQSGD